jgi:hypothetical protein
MSLVFGRPKPVGGASYVQYRRPEGGLNYNTLVPCLRICDSHFYCPLVASIHEKEFDFSEQERWFFDKNYTYSLTCIICTLVLLAYKHSDHT